jgi:hypothetical protein
LRYRRDSQGIGTWVKIRFVNGMMAVRPNESVDIAVLADNLGDWVLHRQNLEHESAA